MELLKAALVNARDGDGGEEAGSTALSRASPAQGGIGDER
jgi:hypothetical protein